MLSDILGFVYIENLSVIDTQERLISLWNNSNFFLSVLKIFNVYLWKFLQRQNPTILLQQSFDPFFLPLFLLFPSFLFPPFLFLFLFLLFKLFLYFLPDFLFYLFEADTSLLKNILQTCHLGILKLFCFFFKLLLYSIGDGRDKSFHVFVESLFHLVILLFYLFRDLIVVLYQDQTIRRVLMLQSLNFLGEKVGLMNFYWLNFHTFYLLPIDQPARVPLSFISLIYNRCNQAQQIRLSQRRLQLLLLQKLQQASNRGPFIQLLTLQIPNKAKSRICFFPSFYLQHCQLIPLQRKVIKFSFEINPIRK